MSQENRPFSSNGLQLRAALMNEETRCDTCNRVHTTTDPKETALAATEHEKEN